jgi:hypothetical protein
MQTPVTVPTPQGPVSVSIVQLANMVRNGDAEAGYFYTDLVRRAQSGDRTAIIQIQMLDRMLA